MDGRGILEGCNIGCRDISEVDAVLVEGGRKGRRLASVNEDRIEDR